MKFVYNLTRLSGDGYKMNANSPIVASPNYITHAQLRYGNYLSPNIIQGTVVGEYGVNSSVLFEITEPRSDYKLYTSTNGTTYTEDKTFGGNTGVSLGQSINNFKRYKGHIVVGEEMEEPTVTLTEIDNDWAGAFTASISSEGLLITIALNNELTIETDKFNFYPSCLGMDAGSFGYPLNYSVSSGNTIVLSAFDIIATDFATFPTGLYFTFEVQIMN